MSPAPGQNMIIFNCHGCSGTLENHVAHRQRQTSAGRAVTGKTGVSDYAFLAACVCVNGPFDWFKDLFYGDSKFVFISVCNTGTWLWLPDRWICSAQIGVCTIGWKTNSACISNRAESWCTLHMLETDLSAFKGIQRSIGEDAVQTEHFADGRCGNCRWFLFWGKVSLVTSSWVILWSNLVQIRHY